MSPPVPAEWSPHGAMWLGFPSHPDLWEEDLEPAQREVADLAVALAGPGREFVKVLACGEMALAEARRLMGATPGIEILSGRFGDIWLRDTGPIFTGAQATAGFQFNGWGGKYRLEGDESVVEEMAALSGARLTRHAFVLEGGALDHDGQGTVLTTRQCLLNSNRNPGWGEAEAEAALRIALGVRKVLWLGDGLMNDHTDGHVDNLARFVAPGVVACPIPFGTDDPNARAYDQAAEALAGFTDAEGAPLRVVRIPSPGRLRSADHRIVPASHMNFLIANGAVVFPVYEERAARFAAEALEELFPGRKVIPLSGRALLTGGGAFHCISQQQPT